MFIPLIAATVISFNEIPNSFLWENQKKVFLKRDVAMDLVMVNIFLCCIYFSWFSTRCLWMIASSGLTGGWARKSLSQAAYPKLAFIFSKSFPVEVIESRLLR